MRLVTSMFVMFCAGSVALGANQVTPWHLEEALKLAAAKVDREDTSVQNARLALDMLQARSRTRVEFRPQLSLLSFSNPIFLAASLGGSFSINRRGAPSPADMELARFAVVEAELGHARARIKAQVETTAQFFALAEAQEAAWRECSGWQLRKREGDKLQTLVAANRITKLDVVRFEQDVTSLAGNCLEAEAQAESAAVAPERLLGSELPAGQLQIAIDDLAQISTASELPASSQLVETALASQGELRAISEDMSNLANSSARRRLQFDSASAGYSYLKNAETGSIAKQSLLGGNVGHLDTGFFIPLRNTGEQEATNAFMQSRFDRLQHDFDYLKATIRHEVEDNQQRAALAAARLRLGQKKQKLADDLHALTVEREKTGLQVAADELWASRDAARAEEEAARLELEWKRSVFTVLALCDPQKLGNSTLLSRVNRPAEPKSSDTQEQVRAASALGRSEAGQMLRVVSTRAVNP